ncbi:MAG: hypothetical protein J6M62_10025 [Selenomonadaceae bacterium]|nr:hypothetical protein [Selenomonadaceae bacterium]MBP3722654.1 hypothetical protein [Selenomonadaceae bacterium]
MSALRKEAVSLINEIEEVHLIKIVGFLENFKSSSKVMNSHRKTAKLDEILSRVEGKSTFASEAEIGEYLRGLREDDR